MSAVWKVKKYGMEETLYGQGSRGRWT